MLNLDTHILIYALRGELRAHEQALLARERWSVSAIVFWEMAKLVQLGRVGMDLEDREVAGILGRVHVWPIDLAVALASTRLDFRGRPGRRAHRRNEHRASDSSGDARQCHSRFGNRPDGVAAKCSPGRNVAALIKRRKSGQTIDLRP